MGVAAPPARPPPPPFFAPRPPPFPPPLPTPAPPPHAHRAASGIGADSVNQSIKAIIIARNYVAADEKPIDCAITCAAVNSEVGPDALSLDVAEYPKTADAPAPEDNIFKCAGTTKPHLLAGAIASRIREGAKHLSVTSVGPMAALRNVKAFCIAKQYVAEDGYDFVLVPFFVHVSVGDEERTGIRLDAFVTKSPPK